MGCSGQQGGGGGIRAIMDEGWYYAAIAGGCVNIKTPFLFALQWSFFYKHTVYLLSSSSIKWGDLFGQI